MISLHVMKVVDFSVTLLYSQLGVALPLGQLLWHRRYQWLHSYIQASNLSSALTTIIPQKCCLLARQRS